MSAGRTSARAHARRAGFAVLGCAALVAIAVPGITRGQAQAQIQTRTQAQRVQVGAAALDAGRRAYAQSGCAVCHGVEGAGTPAGPGLATGALSPEAFIAFVRRPVRSMPAYPPAAVDDAALRDMHAFLAAGPSASGTASATPGDAARGADHFAASGCYQCHANQAQGGMHGPRLGPGPISWPRFVWYVRHPSASMPPYAADVLDDAALRDIYAFLEGLPRPPDVERIPLLAP